jgi:hypothetical protein
MVRRITAARSVCVDVPVGRPRKDLEGKRMASGHTGNVVPGNRLRVRPPCPPLLQTTVFTVVFCVCGLSVFG